MVQNMSSNLLHYWVDYLFYSLLDQCQTLSAGTLFTSFVENENGQICIQI